MNILQRAFFLTAIILVLPSISFAQPFVVISGDAKFYDSIGSTKAVADVARDTRLYGLERKDRWVKAVDPKTKTVAWIPWDGHLSIVRNPEGDRKRRELVKQERTLMQYGIDSPVTTQQLEETIAWAKQIHEICGDVHPVSRAVYLSAAVVSERANAHSTTESLYDKSLEISLNLYGKHSEKTGDIYLDLAKTFVRQTEFAKALKNAKAAILIFGEDNWKSAECWTVLAESMERIGEYKDAIKYYGYAEAGYVKAFGKLDPGALFVRDSIADCYEDLGQVGKAIEIYSENLKRLHSNEILKHYKKEGVGPAIARATLKLKLLQLDLENEAEVEGFTKDLAESKFTSPEIQSFAEHLESKLMSRLLKAGNLASRGAALKIYDANLKALRVKMRRNLWNVSAELQHDYLSFNGGIQFFKAISFAVENKETDKVCKQSLEWLVNAKGLVRETQAMRAGAVTDVDKREKFVNRPFVQLEEVTKVLPQKSVYVDIIRYLEYDLNDPDKEPVENYAAWIANKEGETSIVELGRLKEIDKQIIALKAALLTTAQKAKTDEISAFAEVKPLLEKVSAKIWEPIRSKFGDATTVILSPDQTLWLLPWSAMLNPDGKYAVEKYQIQLELSGRDLIRKSTSGRSTDPVVFADPDFGPAIEKSKSNSGQRSGVRIGSFPQLQFSAKEAGLIKRWIAEFDQSPVVYTGRDAIEARFKSLHSPSILVMSTHGYYLDENGRVSLAGIEQRGGSALNNAGKIELQKSPLLKCGLLLTDGNQHTSIANLENDGVLTGPEIAQTDLQFTKLAVLSACQTGVGTLEPTAGVIGMRSAFHAAGVECVVTTLWPIPDEETVGITNSFFKMLSGSKQVRQSLQLAQKEQIEKRRRLNGAAHPYFWAAFNVSGETKF